MRPATLAIIGTALGAAAGHAFRAPFPGMGGNPVLDLIAYHDPGLHTVIRVWYYAAPAVAVVLAGSVCLSVWRVWLQPPARGGGRGRLPAWPASPEDDAPSLVIGELHHPTVPRESERPSWLVIPETGLYTGAGKAGERRLDPRDELGRRERLDDVVGGAALERLGDRLVPAVAFGLRNPPKTPEHLELELAPENYRLKLSSLAKVCPDKNFKFRVTGHRHPLEPAT